VRGQGDLQKVKHIIKGLDAAYKAADASTEAFFTTVLQLVVRAWFQALPPHVPSQSNGELCNTLRSIHANTVTRYLAAVARDAVHLVLPVHFDSNKLQAFFAYLTDTTFLSAPW
jgi:hypothetical protein